MKCLYSHLILDHSNVIGDDHIIDVNVDDNYIPDVKLLKLFSSMYKLSQDDHFNSSEMRPRKSISYIYMIWKQEELEVLIKL